MAAWAVIGVLGFALAIAGLAVAGLGDGGRAASGEAKDIRQAAD